MDKCHAESSIQEKQKIGLSVSCESVKFFNMLNLKDLSQRIVTNRFKDDNGNTVKWLQNKCLRDEKVSSSITNFCYNHSRPYSRLNVWERGRRNTVTKMKKAYHEPLPQDLLNLFRKEIIPPRFIRETNHYCSQ